MLQAPQAVAGAGLVFAVCKHWQHVNVAIKYLSSMLPSSNWVVQLSNS